MQFSITGQGKGDLLLQVTAWTDLTACRSKNATMSSI